jgi:hypothetical protein
MAWSGRGQRGVLHVGGGVQVVHEGIQPSQRKPPGLIWRYMRHTAQSMTDFLARQANIMCTSNALRPAVCKRHFYAHTRCGVTDAPALLRPAAALRSSSEATSSSGLQRVAAAA